MRGRQAMTNSFFRICHIATILIRWAQIRVVKFWGHNKVREVLDILGCKSFEFSRPQLLVFISFIIFMKIDFLNFTQYGIAETVNKIWQDSI